MAVVVVKVDRERDFGIAPNHGLQHEAGVLGVTLGKSVQSVDAFWLYTL